MTAAQVFKDLEKGNWKPFCLLVGEEYFQLTEVLDKLKAFFLKEGTDPTFIFEKWDGEGLDADKLLESLQTLPGLFSDANETRLVICQRFEKVSASNLEKLESYFSDPSPSTCFVLIAGKADKRRAWYKAVEKKGAILEFSEPSDREWPRWQTYFEKKVGKKFEGKAWDIFVDASGWKLSSVWGEVEKAATFVGESTIISEEAARSLAFAQDVPDVFEFADNVILKKKGAVLRSYEKMLRTGESDIKLLAILVRQFRMVKECQRLMREGITDPKVLAPKIGSHPFYVSKVQAQSKLYSREALQNTLNLLTEADYRIKTGQGSLFENVLVPFFS